VSHTPAPAAGRPVLLINPLSFRASRRGLARRAAGLAQAAGLEIISASSPGHFRAAFDQLHARRQAQVWLLCGDGTIQWIAEYLASADVDWSPALLLLGGGRANVVPRECGGYPALPALRAALRAYRAGLQLGEQPLVTLRLSQPGGAARHGFLLAGGVAHEGVRVCREHRARGRSWLHRGLVADFYALLRLQLQVWLGRNPLPPPAPMSVRMANGRELATTPMRLLLASTLHMRNALYNPFADTGEGSVRVTAIAARVPHIWRQMPNILRGRFGPELTVERGVLSGRCTAAEVRGIARYSLDGEDVVADAALPLNIEVGITLRVLRP
jgi:hypothetical protein